MLDRNSDGNELLGAISGNGFADMTQYDQDSNSFQDKGVGALYLGLVSTPFFLRTQDNQIQRQIRSTGLNLGEKGFSGYVTAN